MSMSSLPVMRKGRIPLIQTLCPRYIRPSSWPATLTAYLHVEATPLDDKYIMAKVHRHMTFEKQAGHPLDFKFFITYFLYDPGDGPKAAFWISHDDEQRVMREAGLVPSD